LGNQANHHEVEKNSADGLVRINNAAKFKASVQGNPISPSVLSDFIFRLIMVMLNAPKVDAISFESIGRIRIDTVFGAAHDPAHGKKSPDTSPGQVVGAFLVIRAGQSFVRRTR